MSLTDITRAPCALSARRPSFFFKAGLPAVNHADVRPVTATGRHLRPVEQAVAVHRGTIRVQARQVFAAARKATGAVF